MERRVLHEIKQYDYRPYPTLTGKKLGDTLENPKYIKTIWGVGYKIEEK